MGAGDSAQIPWRVVTERLLLRPYETDEGPLLGAAIEASLAHLRTHLTWAMEEPASGPARAARIARSRASFAAGEGFAFGIFPRGEGHVVGGIGLSPVDPGSAGDAVPDAALEIGYWLHVDETGRGLATEAAGALSRVAVEVRGATHVVITCDPRNTASAAVPMRLGYRHVETLREARLDPRGEPRDTMVWLLERGGYPRSPAAQVPLRCYAQKGKQLAALAPPAAPE